MGVSNTLELLSNTFRRSAKIDDFDVETSSEHNYAITPRCSFFKSFVMPLELITFPSFLAIPLNSTSFPSQKKIQENSFKTKSYPTQIVTI